MPSRFMTTVVAICLRLAPRVQSVCVRAAIQQEAPTSCDSLSWLRVEQTISDSRLLMRLGATLSGHFPQLMERVVRRLRQTAVEYWAGHLSFRPRQDGHYKATVVLQAPVRWVQRLPDQGLAPPMLMTCESLRRILSA